MPYNSRHFMDGFYEHPHDRRRVIRTFIGGQNATALLATVRRVLRVIVPCNTRPRYREISFFAERSISKSLHLTFQANALSRSTAIAGDRIIRLRNSVQQQLGQLLLVELYSLPFDRGFETFCYVHRVTWGAEVYVRYDARGV